MVKYIKVKADYRDADYVYLMEEISDEDLEKLLPVIKEIKEFKNRRNWSYSYHDKDNIYAMYGHDDANAPKSDGTCKKCGSIDFQCALHHFQEEYVPWSPSGWDRGVHTIESIKIFEVESIERLL